MMKMRAARAAAVKLACAIAAGTLFLGAANAATLWDEPWKDKDKALVIDAYEFNPIDWSELTSDERIAGFINKASDGLPPEWDCGDEDGKDWKLCKNRWWKYSVTKELFMTRREMAKMMGLKWGAYHLGRPGDPRAQADHFINFAEPGPDDLIALDIEDRSEEWMSLEEAEIFADQIKIRLGRYPVLYTNGSTAKYIAAHAEEYPILSRLPIWYARYREDITGLFPEGNWPQYALWQFSSMHNCNENACPYRVDGAKTDIDVNVSPLTVAGLKEAWPFDELIDRPEKADEPAMLIAEADEAGSDETASAEEDAEAETETVVADAGDADSTGGASAETANGEEVTLPEIDGPLMAAVAEVKAAEKRQASGIEDTMVAAYGPVREGRVKVDPLKLLSNAASKSVKGPTGDWKDAAVEADEESETEIELSTVPIPQPRPSRVADADEETEDASEIAKVEEDDEEAAAQDAETGVTGDKADAKADVRAEIEKGDESEKVAAVKKAEDSAGKTRSRDAIAAAGSTPTADEMRAEMADLRESARSKEAVAKVGPVETEDGFARIAAALKKELEANAEQMMRKVAQIEAVPAGSSASQAEAAIPVKGGRVAENLRETDGRIMAAFTLTR